jgi:hypothetical protein
MLLICSEETVPGSLIWWGVVFGGRVPPLVIPVDELLDFWAFPGLASISLLFLCNSAVLGERTLPLKQLILIDFLVVLDFPFEFLKEVGIDDSFAAFAIGHFLKGVHFGNFLVMFLEDLIDLVLYLRNLLVLLGLLLLLLLLLCVLVP